MGLYHKGIPHQIALDLADKHNLTTFLESGTHVGKSSQFAANWFQAVYTIESVPHYFDIAAKNLRHYKNVFPFLGKSQEVLPLVLDRLTDSCLFWLDAHWSRDLQGNKPKVVCPVLDEIRIINSYHYPHVIMVDDARLFGNAGWPSLDNVMLSLSNGRETVWIEQDVIIAV